MNKPRRKPRKCRNCGKSLRTSKTGRWFFCDEVCMVQYQEDHEPDIDPAGILKMRPTDEDNNGVSLGTLKACQVRRKDGER